MRSKRLTPLNVLAILYPATWIIGQYPLEQYVGFAFSVERLLVILLGPLCILEILTNLRSVHILRQYVPIGIHAGAGLWLGSILFSFSVGFAVSAIPLAAGYMQKVGLGFLFCCAVLRLDDIRQTTRLFALSTLLASFCSFYYALSQGLGSLRVAGYVNIEFGDVSLVEGLARAGAIGSIPLMAAWLEASYAQSRSGKIFWIAATLCLYVASMLALRREYLISTTAGFAAGIYILRRKYSTTTKIVGTIIFTVAGGAMILGTQEWRDRLFYETKDTFEMGQDPRTLMLKTAPSIFMEKPLTGHGIGTYPMLMVKHLPLAITDEEGLRKYSKDGMASHNSFATAAVESGLFGLTGLLLLVFNLGLWAWRTSSMGSLNRGSPSSAFAFVFFVQIFVALFFGDGLISNLNWAFLGLLIAIIAKERVRLVGERQHFDGRSYHRLTNKGSIRRHSVTRPIARWTQNS
jgi:hypothetical protein